jgi:peptidoglycan/LPS O-acetylase OafA/YrhL
LASTKRDKISKGPALFLRSDTKISPAMSGWLDLFRGTAAVAVVLGHMFEIEFSADFDQGTSGLLHLVGRMTTVASLWSHDAVIVFFVLSGYLVGGPFLIRLRGGSADVMHYASARIARMYTVIMPALALTLLCDITTLTLFSGQVFIDARPAFFPGREDLWNLLEPSVAACNAAFLQTIACKQLGTNLSLWSLSNEGLYYVIWPSLLLGVMTRRPRLLIPGLAVLILVLFAPFLAGDWPRVSAYLVYIGIWILGACCFATINPPVWISGLATIVALFAWRYANTLLADATLSIAFGAFLKTIDRSAFAIPILRRLAFAMSEISFSLYAIHLPIGVLCLSALGWMLPAALSWEAIVVFIALVILCLSAAIAFWWAFERHTKTVKAKVEAVLSRFPKKA